MDDFLDTLSLASDEILADTKAKLNDEYVALDQLLTVITDEDLEEIGISEIARHAIRIGVEKHRALDQVPLALTFNDFNAISYGRFLILQSIFFRKRQKKYTT